MAYFVIWTIVCVLVGVAIGMYIRGLERSNNGFVSINDKQLKKDLNHLMDKAPERVKQLLKYHNNRLYHGADERESALRLVQDLKHLREELGIE